ncbi:TetR/AcrR family transcriptional regulator [Ornithinibacter aureus]|uniref:TetR/AcrR family transcriptional regulator n=1 Tax=Ornithinibacter aureus TaxID=622664 RepID=A0ABP8J8P1_9MICO|nr:TetR/AcrR family transcriptional regulator [Ornithinibacter aureus]KAF0832910.1 TetR family transcriptional regulator [Ornithinibacter aureus]
MDVTQAPPDRRRSRWDEHRLVRRAELVEATLLAIRTHGAGVGMDEVAATARTSKTVFYRHFTDRAGLYTAVAERVDATIIRDLTRAAADPASDDPASKGSPDDNSRDGGRAVIRGVIAAYLHLVEDDPQVYRFIVNAPMVPAGERPEGDVAAGMTGRIATHVAELVAGGLASGSGSPSGAAGSADSADVSLPALDARACQLWGVALVGMVRAVADSWMAEGGARNGPSSDDLADQLTALVWDGLRDVAANARSSSGGP